MESIKDVLLQIHKSSKKSRVQTSVFLKKIEDIIFKKRERLDATTMRMLLIGMENDVHGLMQICGIRSKFKGSLKNSSFYCMSLLIRLFNEHPQRKDLLQIFYDFDEEEFLSMKLSEHIQSYKKPEQTDAYEIAKLIKLKRPYMNIKSYISVRIAQEKFEDWLKNYKSIQASKQINQKEWKDQGDEQSTNSTAVAGRDDPQNNLNRMDASMMQSTDMRSSNVRARDDKMKKKQSYFKEVHLRNYERNLDYYKVTFSDPLFAAFSLEEDSLKQSKQLDGKVRKRNVNKNLIMQSFAKRVSKPQDLVAEIQRHIQEQDTSDQNNPTPTVDDIIPKIHIESPDFDPIVFLTVFHTKTENKYLTEAATSLLSSQQKNLAVNKSLVYYYIEQFLDVFRGVKKSHLTFIQVEAQNNSSFFNEIRVLQVHIEQVVNKVNSELLSMKSECSTMRSVLAFLQKNQLMLNLPNELKKAYNRHDFERISKLFQQAFPYLRRFRGIKIFTSVYSEIDRILTMSQDIVIALVEKNLDDQVKMNSYTNILLDLQYDYKDTPEQQQQLEIQSQSNVRPPAGRGATPSPSPSLPQQQQQQETKHNLTRLIKFLQKRILLSIQKNTVTIKLTSPSSDNNSDNPSQFNTTTAFNSVGANSSIQSAERQRKLKLIKTIQFDCDRLEQFSIENNIASSNTDGDDTVSASPDSSNYTPTKQVKIRDIEIYLQENLIRFKNFFSLLHSYAYGDFDYKLPISVKSSGQSSSSSSSVFALNHFQQILMTLVQVVVECVAFIERKYNFKSSTDSSKLDLKDSLRMAKKDITSTSSIILLVKQLEQLSRSLKANTTTTPNLVTATKNQPQTPTSMLNQLQERLASISYSVEILDLKSTSLDEYEFYANLSINKTFMHDDEFTSAFSTHIFDSILTSVSYLHSLKLFRTEDFLKNLHKRFLLEAISMCFKTAFSSILKEHSKQVTSQSDYAIATGSAGSSSSQSSSSMRIYEKDEVYLIILSNIQSFKQYQCKALLRQIFSAAVISTTEDAGSDKSGMNLTKQQIDEIIEKQAEYIRDLMQKMVVDIMGKLSIMKAAKLLEGSQYIDLFVLSSSPSPSSQVGGDATVVAAAGGGGTLDSNSMYNASVLQQLLEGGMVVPDMDDGSAAMLVSQSTSFSKYEIRYKILDLLSDIDQYIQTIALHCQENMVRDLPPLLFVEVLSLFKKFIGDNSKQINLLLLKQLRIEMEFLQAITVSIKSIASQTMFSTIYALINKIFETNFGSDPKNVTVFKIDVNKFNRALRETKFKTKLNFKSFLS